MLFKKAVAIDPVLYERLKRCAEKAGYSSVDELIRQALEKEADRLSAETEEADVIRRRMKGLGYV